MFSLFSGRNVPSMQSLLRQFAIEIDNELNEQGFVVLNTPSQSRDAVDIELDIQGRLLSSTLSQMETTEGPILTRTPSAYHRPITIATPDEVREHYNQVAAAVFERKTGTCLGLACVVFSISRALLANEHYRQIEIQVCQLRHWSHVFVRFVHPQVPQGLFYDPWYQRCQTDHPHVPLLIEEHALASKMESLIERTSIQIPQTVMRIKHFMEYDARKQSLTGEIKSNRAYNFDYCILCSSRVFSNPVKIVTEPKGRTSVSTFHKVRVTSYEDTVPADRSSGCVCS